MSRDLDQLIAEISRGERGVLCIRRCTRRGSPPYVDIRHYAPDALTGELGRAHGIELRESEVADLIRALEKALPPIPQPRLDETATDEATA